MKKQQNNWFTIEKIDNSTFAISEYKHWEHMHSYLLIGSENALLIDTGLGLENIKDEIAKLTNLPVKVATTHVHWDHIGGHSLFNEIYVHENEVNWLKNGIPLPLDIIRQNVSKKIEGSELPENFDINKYHVYTGNPTRILKDEDLIDIGNRSIKVIHTPGHSPGHICFYEESRGNLFSGDLIYLGKLDMFYPSTDPVLFKQSIEKIHKLSNLIKILPAHHSLNVSVEIVAKIKTAFDNIEKKNQLKHGTGILDFANFQIHL